VQAKPCTRNRNAGNVIKTSIYAFRFSPYLSPFSPENDKKFAKELQFYEKLVTNSPKNGGLL